MERPWFPGDFRAPQGIRIGLSPLSTSFAELYRGVAAIRELLSGPESGTPQLPEADGAATSEAGGAAAGAAGGFDKTAGVPLN